MKSQATAIAFTPMIYSITVTIDECGRPLVDQEEMCVHPGDFVQWTCKWNAIGRMSISFDPFHSVYAEAYIVAKEQTMVFGPYQIAIDPVARVRHPYHLSWMSAEGTTKYVDPVIIVDPTNTGGSSKR
jgi:hypothetical protein